MGSLLEAEIRLCEGGEFWMKGLISDRHGAIKNKTSEDRLQL